jgi:hypothetical protein
VTLGPGHALQQELLLLPRKQLAILRMHWK